MKKIFVLLIVYILLGFSVSNASYLSDHYRTIKDNFTFDGSPSVYLSKDGKSYAYTIRTNFGDELYVNGKKITTDKDYSYIGSFKFSPDGKSYSYVLKNFTPNPFVPYKQGNEAVLVKNGKKSNIYEEIFDFDYSLDGKSFYFTAKKGGKNSNLKQGETMYWKYNINILVKDGIEDTGKYDAIYGVKYSPDGKSFGFVGEKEGMTHVVVNGYVSSISEGLDTFSDFKFSPNGKEISFLGVNKKGEYIVYKNGKNYKSYKYISDFLYSPDGKYLTVIGNNGENDILYMNGKEITKYKKIYDFKYSKNGKNYVFVLRDKPLNPFAPDDSKSKVVLDGNESDLYDAVYKVDFIGNSGKIAYIAKKDGKEYFINKGVSAGKYDDIRDFYYSKDGMDYVLIVKDGKDTKLIKNGKELLILYPYVFDILNIEISENLKTFVTTYKDGNKRSVRKYEQK